MKRNILKLDKTLFLVTIAFFIFGLVMIFSASSMESYMRYGYSPYYYLYRQAIFLAIGFVMYFIIINIPTKVYKFFAYFLITVCVVALLGLFFYGHTAGGSSSWFKVGMLSIQPSEFTKVFLILFLAKYYDKYRDNLNNKWVLVRPLIVSVLIFIIIVKQPDLGTALIILGLSFFIFYSVIFSKKYRRIVNLALVVCIFMGGVILVTTKGSFLEEYQKNRLNFLDPCERYQEESGYQLCNSFIAFANGGIDGQGIGKSTQKYLYLPESYTDFIFPIIVEEWGLFMGVFIIIVYLTILAKIYMIARKADNLFNSVLAYGVCIYMFLHIAINLLGVMGMAPLTGVPLPFLSYGGSYTISLLIALALVQRVAIENTEMVVRKKRLRMKRRVSNF